MPKGFVYILECSDGTFYTGSTIDLDKRLGEHQSGNGANHTKKKLPVNLVFFEEFQRIDDAFYREKQIQGWSRKKKIALIESNFDKLKDYAECKNDSHYKKWLRLRSATENRLRLATESRLRSATEKPLRSGDDEQQISETPTKNNKSESVAERSRSYSNGKLLITGEYVVLDGALALAVPTKYGQSLDVETINELKIIWESLDEKDDIWFENEFLINDINTPLKPSNAISDRLIQILNAVKQLNSDFINTGFRISTKTDFPKNWGLGTSSTLINNIAQWANVDPYTLLKNTFGGSGYDIACAQNDTPITYQLHKGQPIVKSVNFNPSFKANLYFVHLNKKQNSREGIKYYNENKSDLGHVIADINNITLKMIDCTNLSDFETLLMLHETIISNATKQIPVKDKLYNDFNGHVKSLGAWGGDFVLVTSKENPVNYFKKKGFETIIPYGEMVL